MQLSQRRSYSNELLPRIETFAEAAIVFTCVELVEDNILVLCIVDHEVTFHIAYSKLSKGK